MLVLLRKQGQDILIGGTIKVSVIVVNGGRVRLGIEAPPKVDIVRSEIIDRRTDGLEKCQRSTEDECNGPKSSNTNDTTNHNRRRSIATKPR